MGYNNNNAGMHLIWHRRRMSYDDLDRYDRLAEKKSREKKIIVPVSTISAAIRDDGKEQRKEVDGRMNINQSNEVPKKQKQKKRSGKPKKQQELLFPKHPAYGTEKIIDIDNLVGAGIVSQNLMLMALKREIDIKRILLEVEDIMKKDERTNPEPSWNNAWSCLPMLDKSVIFLNVLAERLDCSLVEFFIDDEKSRKQFLYKFLVNIDDSEWRSGEIDPETGRAYICIDDYGRRFKEVGYQYSTLTAMDLILEKDLLDDGTIWYSLAYGSLSIRPEAAYDYAGMGAYLWEEGEGKLKDYIENLIAKHPEWKKADDEGL